MIRHLSKPALAFIAAMAFTACGGPSIEGDWVEQVPGMENYVQGISLEKDGKASSINMATLSFDSWEKKGDMLILSGKSIGNGVTVEFTDTLTIENLTADSLCLRNGGMAINYHRQK